MFKEELITFLDQVRYEEAITFVNSCINSPNNRLPDNIKRSLMDTLFNFAVDHRLYDLFKDALRTVPNYTLPYSTEYLSRQFNVSMENMEGLLREIGKEQTESEIGKSIGGEFKIK
jgi:hypothetical protein